MQYLKLTPELQQNLVDRLRAGTYFEVACTSVGIHKMTAYGWMSRARDCRAWEEEHHVAIEDEEDLVYMRFLDAVESANADAEVGALAELRQGNSGWQAQAWFLERRFPERWRKRDSITVEKPLVETADTLQQIRAELNDRDLDDLESELRAVLKHHDDDS